MAEMLITDNDDVIDFAPASVDAEIFQNCKMILKTIRSTCPLYRGFGLDSSYVDLPQPQAFARLSQDIVTTFAKYEPRVKVVEIIQTDRDNPAQLPVKVKVKRIK